MARDEEGTTSRLLVADHHRDKEAEEAGLDAADRGGNLSLAHLRQRSGRSLECHVRRRRHGESGGHASPTATAAASPSPPSSPAAPAAAAAPHAPSVAALGAALRVLRLAATRAAKGREGLVQLVVLLLRQPDRARNIRVADYRAGVEVDLHAVVIDNEYLITDD